MKISKKTKKVLCVLGIIGLFLIGLYGATRKQIDEFIMQHKANSIATKADNNSKGEKETQNKSKEQKFKFTYEQVYEAIRNTRTLEGTPYWQYTDTSYSNIFYLSASKGNAEANNGNYPILSKGAPSQYATNGTIYAPTGALKSTSIVASLRDNISRLCANPSATGGRYDILGITWVRKLYIMAVIPGLNIETNNEGIVTSISYCPSIINQTSESIEYKTYTYEQYIKDNPDKTYDEYAPQYTYNIDIADIMRYLGYKSSEYDVEKDFTIEEKNTDIEIYSIHDDGSLELEHTSKTGTITTIKFN